MRNKKPYVVFVLQQDHSSDAKLMVIRCSGQGSMAFRLISNFVGGVKSANHLACIGASIWQVQAIVGMITLMIATSFEPNIFFCA